MSSTFIAARAVKLIELNGLVDANKDPYGERFVHLMEHPRDRDPDIARDAIGYIMTRYADEVDSDELAREYAQDLSGFAGLPFATISEIPLPTRGVLHSTGAALVSAICDRQAWLESVGVDALEIGNEMGRLNKAAASRMSTAQKKTMAKDGGLKKTLTQIETEKKKGGK